MFQAFTLCHGQRGSILCGEGTKIQILSANYGRTDGDICPGWNTAARTCRSKTALNRVKWNCNGYRICHLYASNHLFGNPCVNVSKYLKVKYRCVKKSDGDLKTKQIIAFNAYINKHLTPHRNTRVNVVYDAVYFNHGNAYNTHREFFTAPFGGLYVFAWTSFLAPRKIFEAEILLNGQRKGVGNCNNLGNPGYENCANTVPLLLKTGDEVYIRTSDANFLHAHYSSFEGWKVQ
uniref:Complement C1q-like protein 4 n=1 Tax=Crassostrea virginica TaxID=6565 RepID=A0A8B8CLE1_CRAVI|nr:complement C1q-like protein 4 [Crassostrea virginica]